MGEACRAGRQGAARALGEHGHEEPALPRHALRRRTDRPGHGEHGPPGHPPGLPRPWDGDADAAPGRAGGAPGSRRDRGPGDRHERDRRRAAARRRACLRDLPRCPHGVHPLEARPDPFGLGVGIHQGRIVFRGDRRGPGRTAERPRDGPHLGKGSHPLEARPGGDCKPPRLALEPLRHGGARRRDRGVRKGRSLRRVHAGAAAGDGRLEPRPGGVRQDLRQRGRPPGACRPGQHGPRRRPAQGRLARHDQDPVHRLVKIGDDSGDPLVLQFLLRMDLRKARPGTGRRAFCRYHRSRLRAGVAGAATRVPPGLPERPGHRRTVLRAFLFRPRTGGADRRRRESNPREGGDDGRQLRYEQLSRGGGQSRREAGGIPGETRADRPGQADPCHLPLPAALRRLGGATHRREHRQGRQGDPPGAPRGARPPRGVRSGSPLRGSRGRGGAAPPFFPP